MPDTPEDPDRKDRVESFLLDLEHAITAHQGFFEHGDVDVHAFASHSGNDPSTWCDLEIGNIEAYQPGQGWGSATMRLITGLADRHGLSIYLVAATGQPDDEDIAELPQADLEAFYARYGFLELASHGAQTYMRRPAQDLAADANPIDAVEAWSGRAAPGSLSRP